MNHIYTFGILTKIDEMSEYHHLLQQLNAKLLKEDYLQILMEMIPNGYKMVVVFDEEKPVGLSGYWINTKTYSGKYVELDNVVIDYAYRNKGIGKLLCDFILTEAKQQGCKMAMLDAYLENEPAHSFYEREGFYKRGFHFLKNL